MQDWSLVASISGTDQKALVDALQAEPLGVGLRFDEGSPCVRVVGQYPLEPAAILALLGRLPFELATLGNVHPEWQSQPIYRRTPIGLGLGHYVLESFVAFGGRGHDRLPSRRFLERGPWRLHRGQPDVSLVQFHDLRADVRTAFAQARRGWQWLADGIDDESASPTSEPWIVTIAAGPARDIPSGWQAVLARAAAIDREAERLLPPLVAVLEAALAGRVAEADLRRVADNPPRDSELSEEPLDPYDDPPPRMPPFVRVLDACARESSGSWDAPTLAAVRASLRELAPMLSRLGLACYDAPLPTEGPESLAAALARLVEAAISNVKPSDPGSSRSCPRCGAGGLATRRESDGHRYVYEHGCDACGLAWDEDGGETLGSLLQSS
jgi:hypothetical protein